MLEADSSVDAALHQARHTTKALIMLQANDTSLVERICCLSLEMIPATTKQVMMRSVILHVNDAM